MNPEIAKYRNRAALQRAHGEHGVAQWLDLQANILEAEEQDDGHDQ